MIKTIAICLGMGGLASVAAGQDDRQRFLTDYSPHATGIRGAYTNVEGQYKKTQYGSNEAPVNIQNVKFKLNYYNMIAISSDTTGSPVFGRQLADLTEVHNLRYRFMLAGTGKGGQNVLSSFSPRIDDERPAFLTISYPFIEVRFSGRSYLDLVTDSESQVVSYADGLIRGRPTRAVTVAFSCPGFGTDAMSPRRLELHFDPERRWVCVAKKLLEPASPHRLQYDEVYEYGADDGGWTTPKRVEARDYRDRPETGQLHTVIDILEYNRLHAPLADREFTMSAFGLPEPEGLEDAELPTIASDALAPKDQLPATSHRPPLWLGITLLAAVSALAAYLGFRRRAGRRPPTPPGQPELASQSPKE